MKKIIKNGVKKIRTKLGMTQGSFAQAVDIGQSTVANYEKQIRHPEVPTAFAIKDFAKSKGIKVTLEDIYLRS